MRFFPTYYNLARTGKIGSFDCSKDAAMKGEIYDLFFRTRQYRHAETWSRRRFRQLSKESEML